MAGRIRSDAARQQEPLGLTQLYFCRSRFSICAPGLCAGVVPRPDSGSLLCAKVMSACAWPKKKFSTLGACL